MPTLGRTRHLFQRVSQGLDAATRSVCICLILFMTVEVSVAVFFRYVLDAPLKWGEELARLSMVWAGLLGISVALKDGDHIGLEMLLGKLKGRARAYCLLAGYALIAPFLIILIVWGVKISQVAWGTFMPALQIKWTWSHLAVPVTAVLQLIHLVSSIMEEISSLGGHTRSAMGSPADSAPAKAG